MCETHVLLRVIVLPHARLIGPYRRGWMCLDVVRAYWHSVGILRRRTSCVCFHGLVLTMVMCAFRS